MFLIGLGNGPLFPNFNYLTPENFGSDISQSVIGIQMASAYIGIMLAPALCGLLGQTFGMVIFPFYLILFLCCHDTLDDSCKSGAKEKHKTELIS